MSEQVSQAKLDMTIKTQDLKNMVEAVKATGGTHVSFVFRDSGLLTSSLTPDKVRMVTANFPRERFSKFEIVGFDQNPFSIKTNEISTIVKRFPLKGKKKVEEINLKAIDSRIEFSGGGKKYLNRVEASEVPKRLDMPNIPYTANIATSYENIIEMIEDAIIGSDDKYSKDDPKLTLSVQDGKLKVSRYTSVTEFNTEKENDQEWNITGNGTSHFNVLFVKEAVNSVESEDIVLSFAENMPLLISFDDGCIKTMISPMEVK